MMFLFEKTKKYTEEIQWKSAKTAISGIYPAFSAGKRIFLSKIEICHVLGIANTHLCAKNQKKTNDEILRKSQKTGFSGLFPAFPAGNKFFSKIGLLQKLTSQSREKLVTNGRTNERTNEHRLIYRTSEVTKTVFPLDVFHQWDTVMDVKMTFPLVTDVNLKELLSTKSDTQLVSEDVQFFSQVFSHLKHSKINVSEMTTVLKCSQNLTNSVEFDSREYKFWKYSIKYLKGTNFCGN